MEVMRIKKYDADYENYVQHIIKSCDKELCNAFETLDTFKHFVKWTFPLRRKHNTVYF